MPVGLSQSCSMLPGILSKVFALGDSEVHLFTNEDENRNNRVKVDVSVLVQNKKRTQK